MANKAEGMREGAQLAEFYELGLGEVIPVSAAHGQGVRDLIDALGRYAPSPRAQPSDKRLIEADEVGEVKVKLAARQLRFLAEAVASLASG